MDLSRLDVEPLSRHHDRAGFFCDEISFTEYLRKQAMQDVERDLASCWVMCASGSAEIVGYYTLTAASVDVSRLPPELAKKSGRYHLVGAALLGRLAVNSRYVGQGAGSHLLLNALRRVLRTTETGIGVKVVVVDALHERAAGFYERYGFRRLQEEMSGLRLFLPLKTVRDIFPGEGSASL